MDPQGVGSNTVRFSLNTSGPFLDLSTLCIKSKLTNRGASPLRILGPNIGACISSMRVLFGGQEVDYVQYSNRTQAMLDLLQSSGKQRQLYSEGLGLESEDTHQQMTSAAIPPNGGSVTSIYNPTVLGCLAQSNYFPSALTSGGQCTLECAIVSDAASCCDTTNGTMSTNWVLSDMEVLVDCVQVDSAFLSSLGAHLAGGGVLNLGWKSYSTSFYSILSAAAQISHSRAHSRLNSVLFSFVDAVSGSTNGKERNKFYMSPSADFKSFMQCGEARFPDTRSNHAMAMHYHRLMHAIGSVNNVSHHTTIDNTTYKDNKFIGIQDLRHYPVRPIIVG